MIILVNAASANIGGGVTYIRNVLRLGPEIAPRHQWIVYLPSKTAEEIAPLVDPAAVQVNTYPYANTDGAARIYFDQVQIPRIASTRGADVIYSTTGFGTFWSPCPELLLIRNALYFDPEYLARCRDVGRSTAKIRLRRWYSLFSMRRADTVLFPTQAMRNAVTRYMSLAGKNEQVIHYGIDAGRFAGHPTASVPEAVRPLKEEGVPMVLNVSSYAVHKNLETAIEALPILQKHCPRIRLLTTTSRDHTSDVEYAALKRRAAALGVDDAWVELGYLPRHHLYGLYQAADVFVFPSFTESFGFPMVEAMASGLPVVAAGTDVNREVCGSAGHYFNTFDAQDCARAILDVLHDRNRREAMASASRERGRQFSWRRYTRQLVDTLTSTAALQ